MPNDTQLSIRLSRLIVERLDDLVPWLEDRPDLVPTGHAKRADVIRLALLRGLDALDRERRETVPQGR